MGSNELQYHLDNADFYWPREWEFLFRAAELLRHSLNEHHLVLSRRSAFLRELGHQRVGSNSRELKRYGDDFGPIVTWAARRWASLFDRWDQDRSGYVFEDGFATLFFLRVLWANERIILRGHFDEGWVLETTLARDQERGAEYVARATEAAQEFLCEVKKLPNILRDYPGSLREDHGQALCQHYGFPTDFLDLTFSYDVALYFAEGGQRSLTRGPTGPEHGAIYAFPVSVVARPSAMVTLPPAVMRPRLQEGVFVKVSDMRVRDTLDKFKYRFRHLAAPVCNGLGDIQDSSSPGLREYLFPTSDPIEVKASPIRERYLGEGAPSAGHARKDE